MTEESEAIKETAKAAQEIAKTSGKAIDAGERFGGFLSRYISGSLEQAMGIFQDKLKYMRWERQVRLMQRAEQLQSKIGVSKPTRSIPLKLAIPLFEAASLEDEDYLQDLWARLLVNAANEESQTILRRAYISVLEQLTSFDAAILLKIYSLPYEETRHKGVVVGNLPNEVTVGKDDGKEDSMPEATEEVQLALANLARLGCISISKSWGGGEIFKKINPTLLGKSLVEACTINANET